MGGAVALVYSALHRLTTGVIALNPAVSLSSIVWESPLCRPIKEDYLSYGYQIDDLIRAHVDFEPIAYKSPQTSRRNVFLGYGSYDMVTSPKLYKAFEDCWNLTHTREYKCGHLNLLRVPRVANDLYEFWLNFG